MSAQPLWSHKSEPVVPELQGKANPREVKRMNSICMAPALQDTSTYLDLNSRFVKAEGWRCVVCEDEKWDYIGCCITNYLQHKFSAAFVEVQANASIY